MGAEEGGEGLKLQWISKLVCYWREWRGEVYSTWKCRTCRNCVANSMMSGQLRITCEAFCCHGFAGTVKGGLRRCYSIFHSETKCWRQYLPQPLSFKRSCTAAVDGFESFSLSFNPHIKPLKYSITGETLPTYIDEATVRRYGILGATPPKAW